MTSQDTASFARQVRWALHHLYDPGELRASPLMACFGLDAQQGPAALRRVLLEGIEALKPRASTPADAKGWRTYRALYYRYSEQFPPQQVAKALGLSERQLRRQEGIALGMLADYLLTRYDILQSPCDAGQPAGGEGPQAPSREEELHYLEKSLPSEAVALEEIVHGALKTAAPLQRALGVTVECTLPAELPRLAGQGASLRQAL